MVAKNENVKWTREDILSLVERGRQIKARRQREAEEWLVAEKEADPTLLTKEEFFTRIDKAEKQIEQGACTTFDNVDDMNKWLDAL